MQAQRDGLIDQLLEHGWRIASKEQDLEWWADEMWLLESMWSTVDSRAYVTFLVDPQFDDLRKKGEAVWAVMASSAKPTDWRNTEGNFTISLSQGWQKRLPEIIGHLNALRQRRDRDDDNLI